MGLLISFVGLYISNITNTTGSFRSGWLQSYNRFFLTSFKKKESFLALRGSMLSIVVFLGFTAASLGEARFRSQLGSFDVCLVSGNDQKFQGKLLGLTSTGFFLGSGEISGLSPKGSLESGEYSVEFIAQENFTLVRGDCLQ